MPVGMAFEHSNFDANLAAAAGQDAALRAELIACFAQSMNGHIDLLRRARCDGNWEVAAQRLNGLAVSFHNQELAKLAQEAIDSAPGDPAILRKLGGFATRFDRAD